VLCLEVRERGLFGGVAAEGAIKPRRNGEVGSRSKEGPRVLFQNGWFSQARAEDLGCFYDFEKNMQWGNLGQGFIDIPKSEATG
jgi:hypothetical protein